MIDDNYKINLKNKVKIECKIFKGLNMISVSTIMSHFKRAPVKKIYILVPVKS
jgi:hypothetical protein